MKRTMILIIGALLTTPAAAQERRTIPPAYQGDWALSAAQCAPGPADSGNMRITRRTIRTFESRIDVRRVRTVGTSSIEVTSRVHHGGGVYGDQARLTLVNSDAHGDLVLGIGDGEEQVFYVRCRS
jgi:hypothetical protein